MRANYTSVLIRREKFEHRKKMAYEDTGRKIMWSWRQRWEWRIYKPESTKCCQKTPEAESSKDPPLRALEMYGPPNNLILDVLPPEPWENKFLLFQTTQFVVIIIALGNECSIYLRRKNADFAMCRADECNRNILSRQK